MMNVGLPDEPSQSYCKSRVVNDLDNITFMIYKQDLKE